MRIKVLLAFLLASVIGLATDYSNIYYNFHTGNVRIGSGYHLYNAGTIYNAGTFTNAGTLTGGKMTATKITASDSIKAVSGAFSGNISAVKVTASDSLKGATVTTSGPAYFGSSSKFWKCITSGMWTANGVDSVFLKVDVDTFFINQASSSTTTKYLRFDGVSWFPNQINADSLDVSSVIANHVAAETLDVTGWGQADYWTADTFVFDGQVRTTYPDTVLRSGVADSAVVSASAHLADSADYAPVIGGAGGSFFSVHVVDTLWTTTDTVGADTTSDTVCLSGGLWAWTPVSSVPLRTNTGDWDTLTASLTGLMFDSLALCDNPTATFDREAAVSCSNAGSFAPDGANQNDTFFVYRPLTKDTDCTRIDSVAIYSYYAVPSWWWKPVCVVTASAWQIVGADCYAQYDSVYAVVFGDTILVAADSVRY